MSWYPTPLCGLAALRERFSRSVEVRPNRRSGPISKHIVAGGAGKLWATPAEKSATVLLAARGNHLYRRHHPDVFVPQNVADKCRDGSNERKSPDCHTWFTIDGMFKRSQFALMANVLFCGRLVRSNAPARSSRGSRAKAVQLRGEPFTVRGKEFIPMTKDDSDPIITATPKPGELRMHRSDACLVCATQANT